MTTPLIGLSTVGASTSSTPTSAKQNVKRASSSHGEACIMGSSSSGINRAPKKEPQSSNIGFSDNKKPKLVVKEPQSSLSNVGHLGGN